MHALLFASVMLAVAGADFAVSADRLEALRVAERAAFLADLKAGAASLGAKAWGSAVAAATVRRAERFKESLRDGRLREGPTVSTIYGNLTGVTSANVTQFLGVPFALPPVGSLRWRAPVKPTPWGSRTAQWWGPTCPQTEADTWALFTGTSEDCLNLNVYMPSRAPPPGGYPIMVFFYGGSFTYGSAGFPLYDGFFEVSLLQNTIIIAANYRVGVLGFLAGDALRAESPDGSVGTYGTADQRAALEFVRDTAAAFNGNPKSVTIFGESAGAASVSQHLVSPRSRGLFSGAIIESGAFSVWTTQPYNISKTRLPQFAANVGCAGASDDTALLACLRAVNASEVLKGDRGLTSAFLEWSPAIDGVEVIDDPRTLLAEGKVADVPVMIGFNADEGSMFARAPKDLNESQYVAAIATILPLAQAKIVAAEYPCSAFTADLGQSACWWAIARLERDFAFACPAQAAARTLATLPSRNSAASTYAYFYQTVLFIVDIVDLFKPYRCFHGSELPLVFDLWPALWGEGEGALGSWFSSAWTTFAATGSPNYAGAPTWSPVGSNGNTAFINTGAAGVNVTNVPSVLTDVCAFWAANPVSSTVIWG